MANITRVRVELKKKYGDPHRNFKDMFQEFKRRVSNAGILHDVKDHEFYMSKGEKARKKKKESVSKMRQEILEQRIMSGERVQAPAGVVKKILANQKKEQRSSNRG